MSLINTDINIPAFAKWPHTIAACLQEYLPDPSNNAIQLTELVRTASGKWRGLSQEDWLRAANRFIDDSEVIRPAVFRVDDSSTIPKDEEEFLSLIRRLLGEAKSEEDHAEAAVSLAIWACEKAETEASYAARLSVRIKSFETIYGSAEAVRVVHKEARDKATEIAAVSIIKAIIRILDDSARAVK